jgi:SAM-dependent methyltransferase
MRSSHNWLIHKINRQIVVDNLNIINGIVYDLGCGNKPYKNLICSKAENYVGVDWGNTYHNHEMDIQADLNKELPIEDEVADTVVSFQVLEHLSEPKVFLRESRRILKKNGNVLITVPFQWHVHEAPYDYFRYTPFGLKYLLSEAGYNSIEIKSNGGFWVTFILKFNYQSIRWLNSSGLLRKPLSFLFSLIWYINQNLAVHLNRIDYNEDEAVSYTIRAKK